MRNYCGECEDILIDPIEWRWGYCLYCLSIKFEQLDEALADLWYDEEI